jgi:hypothetical protein
MKWGPARTLAGLVMAAGLGPGPAAAFDGGSAESIDAASLAGQVQPEPASVGVGLAEFDQQAEAHAAPIVALQVLHQRELKEIEHHRVLEEQRRLEEARRLEEQRRASAQATARAQAARQQASPGGSSAAAAAARAAAARSSPVEPTERSQEVRGLQDQRQDEMARVVLQGQYVLVSVDELHSLRAELEAQREELRQLRELLTQLLAP